MWFTKEDIYLRFNASRFKLLVDTLASNLYRIYDFLSFRGLFRAHDPGSCSWFWICTELYSNLVCLSQFQIVECLILLGGYRRI